MFDSPTPDHQQLSTTKNAKTNVKGTSPTKVVKRTGTLATARVSKNSPYPKVQKYSFQKKRATDETYKTKAEIQPYDQLILDLRGAPKPPSWKEIENLFREAGGKTSGYTELMNHRYPKLKAMAIEVSDEDVSLRSTSCCLITDTIRRFRNSSYQKLQFGRRLKRRFGDGSLRI